MPEAVESAKKFLRESAGYPYFRLIEVKPDESKSQWIVAADVGAWMIVRKEVIVDDKDGNVIGYR